MAQRELILRDSSNVQRAWYDPDTQELTIQFNTGSTGAYTGVPSHEADTFEAAQSHGKYIHDVLKNLYPWKRL